MAFGVPRTADADVASCFVAAVVVGGLVRVGRVRGAALRLVAAAPADDLVTALALVELGAGARRDGGGFVVDFLPAFAGTDFEEADFDSVAFAATPRFDTAFLTAARFTADFAPAATLSVDFFAADVADVFLAATAFFAGGFFCVALELIVAALVWRGWRRIALPGILSNKSKLYRR